ncbi:hypothetical protein B0T16DRAFT_98456 [Cercophora newfieldiana]|uniref:Uncharacterized protein n=1 Tax=Cercophora newfieldiana TaxID=92897 RepID=A0AA39YGK5_9PEZI|nr:hypothetical protein B0T16DRAFT_98456 [Cercophora newfieldiana]
MQCLLVDARLTATHDEQEGLMSPLLIPPPSFTMWAATFTSSPPIQRPPPFLNPVPQGLEFVYNERQEPKKQIATVNMKTQTRKAKNLQKRQIAKPPKPTAPLTSKNADFDPDNLPNPPYVCCRNKEKAPKTAVYRTRKHGYYVKCCNVEKQ